MPGALCNFLSVAESVSEVKTDQMLKVLRSRSQ